MIYWLQETTHQLRRSSSPSATLTGATVGAVVGLVGVLIGQVLQQRRHSQTLQETQRRHSEDLRQAEQGQITERFTRAIDQLGSEKLEIRLGGIYALERIARDSPERDYVTVMEVLTAYIRENAPWAKPPWPQTTQNSPLPADIREILRVLARREESQVPKEYRVPLDLQKTNLSGVEVRRVNLKRANLSVANLSAADLLGTDLEGADLWDADLQDANLERANLKRAVFGSGSCPPGELGEANLEGADLSEANLEDAFLEHVNLTGASLYKANLKGADLNKARGLDPEQLELAIGDATTKLPDHLQLPAHWSKGESEEDEGG